jgi:hypothetical protein
MSKQPPKQRTLDFFMQKKKTQGQGTSGSNPANKSSSGATGATKTGGGVKTAKSNNTSNVAPAVASKTSPMEDIASSPLPLFPSSRSIPSDSRSVSSGHSVSRSRASSPPASEAPDVDMMDEEEEVVGYRPVRSSPLYRCDLMLTGRHPCLGTPQTQVFLC